MSDHKRVYIILGTRPEAIKLAPVIQAFQNCSNLDTKIILTGQHREMVEQVMKLFSLDGDLNLEIMQHHQSLSKITCRSLQGLEKLFVESHSGLVIVQGDTTTAFTAALAAFYHRIPIGHVEAGLRTNNLFNPFPEEVNRRLISQMTQLHFAPTPLAVENLKESGVLGEIHLTGNTIIDALFKVAATEPVCNVPGLDWENSRVLLATVHRRENWGNALQQIAEGFLQILNKFPDTALLLPLHRNPTVRGPLQALLGNTPRIFLTEPLNYEELVGAITRSYLLLTDSGGLQEEAPSLGKPVLVLRETTERPEAIVAGTAKLVGNKANQIFAAASELLGDSDAYETMANAINPFGDGHASERILQIVQNYLLI
ncbi:MAG TPA: UDP-N-acetylglucosamine 2-epimerase (non-hydrolyzing) [Richelia sp.]|nr:UDP-N-acetylglucosamine 2-epimerase (non-hydrolyzing) [Richelia sp.]